MTEIVAQRDKSIVEEISDGSTEIFDGIDTQPRHWCRFHHRRIIVSGFTFVAAAVILAPAEIASE